MEAGLHTQLLLTAAEVTIVWIMLRLVARASELVCIACMRAHAGAVVSACLLSKPDHA